MATVYVTKDKFNCLDWYSESEATKISPKFIKVNQFGSKRKIFKEITFEREIVSIRPVNYKDSFGRELSVGQKIRLYDRFGKYKDEEIESIDFHSDGSIERINKNYGLSGYIVEVLELSVEDKLNKLGL